MGTLSRTVTVDASRETIIAQTSDGRIWSDLPFLVQDIQDAWKESLKLPVNHRRNLAAFIAKLTAVGIWNDSLAGCALITFREALETPRRLDASEDGSEVPIADLIPALQAWLVFASDKFIALSDKSFNRFEEEVSAPGKLAQDSGIGPGGFSPPRWTFWKKRLEFLSQVDGCMAERRIEFNVQEYDSSVGESTFQCLRIMKDSAEHINGVLTEPDDMFK